MKNFIIFLSFFVLSFSSVSKTNPPPAKEKIDFDQAVTLEGHSQNFNNRCIPKFGKPAKLFSQFVKLQTRLIALQVKLDKANTEDARLSDKNTRLHKEYNQLKSVGRPVNNVFLEEYKNMLRENDQLVAEGDRLFKKEYVINTKFSSLQLKLNQLQRMFYLSLPLGSPSAYALRESATILKKQITLMKKQIFVVQNRTRLVKKQIALVQRRIALFHRADQEMVELTNKKSPAGDKSSLKNSVPQNIKFKSRTIASPSENNPAK